jgi:hypothetical protein
MRLLSLLAAFSLYAQSTDVSALGWMRGCWEMRTPNGMTVEEQWTKPAGGTMLGMGRTMRNGKTVFTEFMRISEENGRLTYTARIGTKGVTPFPLLKMSEGEVVFENPQHDFPQRVIYRKQGSGLFARVEGMNKGKEQHEDFVYQRVSCE